MFKQLNFYIKHSFNDLRVNGQRTLFALLCIAAGVAAIVSLQTLAVMISDTLTGNLQANNRGDIQFQTQGDFTDDDALTQIGLDDGVISSEEVSFFGQTSTNYFMSPEGFQIIQDWVDENYPNQVEMTYLQPLDNIFLAIFGNGIGASITQPDTGAVASQMSSIVVDVDVYPFYSEVETKDGNTLAEAITEPNHIVLSEQIAGTLDVEVGQTVRLNGSEADFIVTGIVDTNAEVKNPGADIFNAFFGFYYLDRSALTLFDDVSERAGSAYIQLANPTPELVDAFNDAFQTRFPYLTTNTTEELRDGYRSLSDAIADLVMVMGLISMLLGSIGIINTMQVIVRRRTVEVAVLKTIGLQANQVTTLFLVEAVIMGIIGSLIGIVMGWGATFIIKGAAETLVANELPFKIVPEAALNGFVLGIIVTTIFGFLPTLTAGQVRPGLVLRPSGNLLPRAGWGRTIFALIVIIAVLSGIAFTILGSLVLSVILVVGAFIGVGLLYILLWVVIWLISRFMPAFGIVDLKISLKQMNAGRGRAAMTLLALVIGVFSLSLITLMAESITSVLEFALEESAGGNIAITIGNQDELIQVENIINAQEGVNSYQVVRTQELEIVSFFDNETGLTIDEDGMRQRLAGLNLNPFGGGGEEGDSGGGPFGGSLDNLEGLQSALNAIDTLPPEDLPTDLDMQAGRMITPEDGNARYIVVSTNIFIDQVGITVGDTLDYLIPQTGEVITFEVIGLEAESLVSGGFTAGIYAPLGSFPEGVQPNTLTVIVDIDEDFVQELRRELVVVPSAFVLDTALFVDLINNLLATFTAFPTMVALLGLLVGGVVIANSVALTTMERRREIAVMKAVGLQRERVLGMILMENGVLGLIGGLIGVGSGILGLLIIVQTIGFPSEKLPWVTALLLMLLCIGVALVAAITTAWGASGEKPLNVLRYE